MTERSADKKEALERISRLMSKIRKLYQLQTSTQTLEEELTETRFHILLALDRPEKEILTMGELSKETGVAPSNLSRAMRDLELNLQYVARERDAEDLRSITVKLTPAGRKALKAYQAARLSYYQEILDRCSDEELKLLDQAIAVFEAKVDEVLKSLDNPSQEEGSEL